MKVIIFYWLKQKSDTDRLRRALQAMENVDKVIDCIVGTPKIMEDDIMDMSYDVALELTLASADDFQEVFEAPEHKQAGLVIREVAEKVQGYNITY